MSMKKTLFVLLVAAMAISSLSLFSSCSKDDEDSPNGGSEELSEKVLSTIGGGLFTAELPNLRLSRVKILNPSTYIPSIDVQYWYGSDNMLETMSDSRGARINLKDGQFLFNDNSGYKTTATVNKQGYISTMKRTYEDIEENDTRIMDIKFSYNKKGQLTKVLSTEKKEVMRKGSMVEFTEEWTYSYTYDSQGRITQSTINMSQSGYYHDYSNEIVVYKYADNAVENRYMQFTPCLVQTMTNNLFVSLYYIGLFGNASTYIPMQYSKTYNTNVIDKDGSSQSYDYTEDMEAYLNDDGTIRSADGYWYEYMTLK